MRRGRRRVMLSAGWTGGGRLTAGGAWAGDMNARDMTWESCPVHGSGSMRRHADGTVECVRETNLPTTEGLSWETGPCGWTPECRICVQPAAEFLPGRGWRCPDCKLEGR